ncbi:MAG TPA: 6-phosphogluconolactonase [Candidatus Limnocylindrales bacterium]|nr:6-phosphogluconolactonase [Candidatus Limnocylindrales bacterium]
MQLIRLSSIQGGAEPLYQRLVEELETGDKVLWLVPGGSNIPLSAEISKRLPEELTKNLTIYLTDERYGDVWHADSNTRQLDEAGFEPKQATMVPVLTGDLTLEETTEHYADALAAAFVENDVVIGQFGMGPDGHIAGILPGSPAVDSTELAAGYQTESFTRITMTPEAIQHVDAAYVYAFGDAKREALENLERELPLVEQPAQILKQLPESFVYNDQIGEDV